MQAGKEKVKFSSLTEWFVGTSIEKDQFSNAKLFKNIFEVFQILFFLCRTFEVLLKIKVPQIMFKKFTHVLREYLVFGTFRSHGNITHLMLFWIRYSCCCFVFLLHCALWNLLEALAAENSWNSWKNRTRGSILGTLTCLGKVFVTVELDR